MAEHQLHDKDEAVDEEPVKAEEAVETEEPTSKSASGKSEETEAKAEDATADESEDSEAEAPGKSDESKKQESDESGKKDSKKSENKDSKKDASEDMDEDEFGLSMDKVEAVLNQSVDKKHMTPQMRRIVQRQEENTKRVEDTIKGTKANPRWFVPLFVTLMLLGLIWIVVYYISSTRGNVYPIPQIGNWNLAVGFGIGLVGFLMTMWWH